MVRQDHRDVPLLRKKLIHHHAADIDIPFGWRFQAGNEPKQSGLSGAFRTRHNQEFPFGRFQCAIPHRYHSIVERLTNMPQ